MKPHHRNMLELALIHVRLDNVLQGDSWGIVYPSDKKITPNGVFTDIATDVFKLRDMSDEELLAHAEALANDSPRMNDESDDIEDMGYVLKISAFETYALFHAEVGDGGDLDNQVTLDWLVKVIQLGKEVK